MLAKAKQVGNPQSLQLVFGSTFLYKSTTDSAIPFPYLSIVTLDLQVFRKFVQIQGGKKF
jgi:hypothetical protein